MSDYLVDHALANAWCTPDQDRQYIFRPIKISPMEGVFNRVTVLFDSITLPSASDRYHVYQIGQVPPDLLNIVGDINTWRPVSRVCRELNLVVDLYASNGLQFPRFGAWILITLDKNVIIAVKDIPKLSVSLRTVDLYIRFYSNAYFNSIRNISDGHPDSIYVNGKVIATNADILAMQTSFAQYRAMIGLTYGFVNGFYTDVLSVANMHVGDVVEFVYDSTIYKTFNYVVSDLDTFHSTLDSKQKFLLHSSDYTSNTIEFHDDIDFFLFKTQSNTTAKGLYFHKNLADAVRSITHVDYSVPTTYVEAYVGATSGDVFASLADVTIRMHVRRSGYQRTLINEATRVKELYKLPAVDIKNTLVGIGSNFTLWSAANLESSKYPQIMRSYGEYITLPLVVEAYGYNAISKIIADTPLVMTASGGNKTTKLPVALQEKSTIYEYDSNGVLINFYTHTSGESHVAVNFNCSFIEAVTGIGGNSSGSFYDVTSLALTPGVEYRFYKATKTIDGNPDEWFEAVLGTDYTIASGTATWIISSAVWFTMIRQDGVFASYNYTTDADDPVYRFSINAGGVFGGTSDTRPMQVPTGELDIWFNKRSLVENIDYYVNWPEICIVSKRYVVGTFGNVQNITIRARGFPDQDVKFHPGTETGFVRHGELSRNGLYNIRDDKVVRIVADGRTMLKSSLQFGEGGVFQNNNPINGTPYSVRDLRVFCGKYLPLTGSPNARSSHYQRALAITTDTLVSNYLTLKLPEAEPTGPSVGANAYELYSPFCARIAVDIHLGNISQAFANTNPTDPQVRAVMEPYEFLLQYDPCLKEDTNFNVVSIHPHPYNTTLPITFAGYKLLQKVIRIYLEDRIAINGFFTII